MRHAGALFLLLLLFLKELKKQKRFAIDLETTHLDPRRSNIVGLAISWQEGETGGDGRAMGAGNGTGLGGRVNLGHRMMRSFSSGMVTLLRGLHSKIRRRMASSSDDNGSIDFRNWGSFR